MIDMISQIPYLKIKVTMKTFQNGAILPQWLGSAIRGALGAKLLEKCCVYPEYECQICDDRCSAGILFGTSSSEKSEETISPYIVNCEKDVFDGESIYFYITLFAEGTDTFYDVADVLMSGLELGADRVPFFLTKVTDALTGREFFNGSEVIRPELNNIECLKYENVNRIMVEFITPYKTKIKLNDFGFEQLIRAVFRRLSTLIKQSGGEINFDFKLMIEKSKKINMRYKDVQIEKVRRYSNRSEMSMNLTCFTGMMVFEGELDEFVPYLKAVEVLNCGKMCVMGFGETKVSFLK